jgi:hypothetical protein
MKDRSLAERRFSSSFPPRTLHKISPPVICEAQYLELSWQMCMSQWVGTWSE